ncbi:TPA: RHS repeat-associated core domain-containing protein [Morganella morganii]
MTEYFSQSRNFLSSLTSGVDPRTGIFSFNLLLGNITGNSGLGPNADIQLTHANYNSTDFGLGNGITMPLTVYDAKEKNLTLSTGEQYLVYDTPTYVEVRQKKIDSFHFERTEDHYKITYKSGVVEILDGPNSGNAIKNVRKILTPTGHSLNFKWNFKGFMRLSEISDNTKKLIEINYDDIFNPVITIFPSSSEKKTYSLILMNGYLREIKFIESGYTWKFDYNDINFISKIIHPTQFIESIDYQSDVINFPENILPPFPAAVRHSQSPGFGQPEITKLFTYTSNNYLGFGSGLNFHPDADNLYSVLNNYTYGSTEIQKDGDITVTTQRKYNNFHLLTEEIITRQDALNPKTIAHSTYEYYAVIGIPFDEQPPQFQTPRKKILKLTDENLPFEIQSREEVTISEFDIYGNPIKEESPDGTITLYEYYPALGTENLCPPEPNGFVRFLKSKTTIPRKSSYDDIPEHTSKFTYGNLGETDTVVQLTRSEFKGSSRLLMQSTKYNSDINNPEFGRIISLENTKYCDGVEFTSTLDFTTTISNEIMTQTAFFTGHDRLTTTSQRIQSIFTGLLLTEIDTSNVKTCYEYDACHRLCSCISSVNTIYENKKVWEYSIESLGLVTLERDASGNQHKTYFDSLGREISQYRYDSDNSNKWFQISTCNYNKLGDYSSSQGIDWVISSENNFVSNEIKSKVKYDQWGQESVNIFSDNTVNIKYLDPVAMKLTTYSQGGEEKAFSGKKVTEFDIVTKLPVIDKMLDSSGSVRETKYYTHDGLGQLREIKDERGHVTKFTYDAFGRVITTKLPDGTIVNKEYAKHTIDELATAIQVIGKDTFGNTKKWFIGSRVFDSLGRITEETVGGRTTKNYYDSASPLPQKVVTASGVIIKQTYIPELQHAIRSTTSNNLTKIFTYDVLTGELISTKEGDIENNAIWTTSGDLKEEYFIQNGVTRQASHTHTLEGNVLSYTDITGHTTQYVRDQYGRVIHVIDDILNADIEYDDFNRFKSRRVSDKSSKSVLTTQVEYDDFGRETLRIVKDSNSKGATISQTWLKANLLERRQTTQGDEILKDEVFSYDSRNRLINYNVTGTHFPQDGYGQYITHQSYKFDCLNNISTLETTLADGTKDTATFHFNNPDDPMQLSSVTHTHKKYPGIISLKYDAEGRMVLDETGRTLRYDEFGRLKDINTKGKYGYDALDRLVTQTINDTEQSELYYRDNERVNEIITPHREIRLLKTGHSCLAVNDGNGLILTGQDQNDSLLWSCDSEQDKGTLYHWSPYGSGTDSGELPGFNGERIDPISGVYHLGNGYRAFNPILMRFNCPDSLSPFDAGGINPYAYCAGDPINNLDPSGHIGVGGWVGIGLGILGILGAIFTLGASLVAATMGTVVAAAAAATEVGVIASVSTAGIVAAAVGSASALSLVAGTASIVADSLSIASGALEDTNPQASAILGWVSLGFGVAAIGAAASKGAMTITSKLRARIAKIQSQGLGGRGALGAARKFAEQADEMPVLTNTKSDLYAAEGFLSADNIDINQATITKASEYKDFKVLKNSNLRHKFIFTNKSELIIGSIPGNVNPKNLSHPVLASFAEGKVVSAGYIYRFKKFIGVVNHSGHYKPGFNSLKYVRDYIRGLERLTPYMIKANGLSHLIHTKFR